jgi:phosphonate transport system substrate-binding protein
MLAQYAEREQLRFREVFLSEPYPELAVIAHPRVAPDTVEKVRQGLLRMKDDPAAAPILARARFKGFDPATDRDYDGVRRVYRQIRQ